MWGRVSWLLSIGMASAATLLGCGAVEPGATSPPAGKLTASEYDLAYRLAEARCERQTESCATFSSRDSCIGTKLQRSADEARLQSCNEPVDERSVARCISEIRREPCGTGIARLEDCRADSLCPYTSEEGTL